MFAALEHTAREAGRNMRRPVSGVRYVDAINMYVELRDTLIDYVDPPSGRWGWDWTLGEMKILGWGTSVVYEVHTRAHWFRDIESRDIPLDGKAMDAIVARRRWRRAALWAKAAVALRDLLGLSLAPGHRGAKRAQADFEERAGKAVRAVSATTRPGY